jgi:hypothetical protein
MNFFCSKFQWRSVGKYKKKKRTPVSLSSSMCCYLYVSNEEILFFQLVVSVSITAASFSSDRTRKRTRKNLIYIILRSTKWIECCVFLYVWNNYNVHDYVSLIIIQSYCFCILVKGEWIYFIVLFEMNIIIRKSRAIGHRK